MGLLGNGRDAGLSSCDALNRCIAFIHRATDSSMYSVVKSDNLSKLCFLKCDLIWKGICQGDWCIMKTYLMIITKLSFTGANTFLMKSPGHWEHRCHLRPHSVSNIVPLIGI